MQFCVTHRVELLADEFGTTINLAPLRASIKSLQFTSIQLDKAKAKAEARLERLIRKWRRHEKLRACLKKAWKKIKGIFKHHKDKDGEDEHRHIHSAVTDEPCARKMRQTGRKPRVGRLPAWKQEKEKGTKGMHEHHHGLDSESGVEKTTLPDLPDLPEIPEIPEIPEPPKIPKPPKVPKIPGVPDIPDIPGHPKPPKKPHHSGPPKSHPHKHALRKFIKAAKEVQKINEKLASFERGLIHPDGLKDREWYRVCLVHIILRFHFVSFLAFFSYQNIAIAPGKWLGERFPLISYS